MSILRPEDVGKHNSIGWLGTKYFNRRGAEMNRELCNSGLQEGNTKIGYNPTELGEKYFHSSNEWNSEVVDFLYENNESLRAAHDRCRRVF